jgi:hypothetical protein
MTICCACQEANATVTRLCGHEFCDECDKLIDQECRTPFCTQVAELAAKDGVPYLPIAQMTQEIREANTIILETEMIEELEDLAIEQEKDLNEFIEAQAGIRKRRMKEAGQRLDKAATALKIAEQAVMSARPGPCPYAYHKASELTLASSKWRRHNMYERGLIEAYADTADRPPTIRLRYGLRGKISQFVIKSTASGVLVRMGTSRDRVPRSDEWCTPDNIQITGVTKTQVLLCFGRQRSVESYILIDEVNDWVEPVDPSANDRKVRELMMVEPYEFDGVSCVFPDNTRVFFDDPSIRPIPDKVKSAPKTMFHEIRVTTPLGERYLQVPRTNCT